MGEMRVVKRSYDKTFEVWFSNIVENDCKCFSAFFFFNIEQNVNVVFNVICNILT